MDPTPHLLLPRGRERRALSNRPIHSTSSLSGFLLSICTFLPLLLLWPIFCFLNKKWAITGLFFSLFSSFQQLIVNMFIIKSCRWLDLNYGPLVSEVTALPTEPQPLPTYILFVGTATQLVILPTHSPWIGHGGGTLLLHYSTYDLYSGLAIFILHGRGENALSNLIKAPGTFVNNDVTLGKCKRCSRSFNYNIDHWSSYSICLPVTYFAWTFLGLLFSLFWAIDRK